MLVMVEKVASLCGAALAFGFGFKISPKRCKLSLGIDSLNPLLETYVNPHYLLINNPLDTSSKLYYHH